MDDDLPIDGDLWGDRYRIERRIGVGGMAAVFSAIHIGLEQRVAIKVLLREWWGHDQIKARFAAEGRAASKIRSEHVVRVFDVDHDHGRPYLVMEYLDGDDLGEIVAEKTTIPVATAVDYILQACEALAEAHALGIIHRDLKPANLFLTKRADGSPLVKVLDFGISKAPRKADDTARATLPTALLGSPHYMSPEQMTSATNADARSDIWSLGAILYELLSGRLPFTDDSVTALWARILREAPPRLTTLRADVPEALEEVVGRCLEKDPERRYATVAELARALSPFGGEEAQASARTITSVIEGTPTSRSNPMLPVVSAQALLARSERRLPRAHSRLAGYVYAAIVAGAAVAALVHMAGPRLPHGLPTFAWAASPRLAPAPVLPSALDGGVVAVESSLQ